MERKEELLQMFDNADSKSIKIIVNLIDDVVYLEKTLDKLRKLPTISVNPKNKSIQKPTPSAKQYKEFLQQYANLIKILLSLTGENQETATSALREGLKKLSERYEQM